MSLFCIRISVSIDTPKAFSMRSAISGERLARSLRSADSVARVTPSACPGSRHRQLQGLDDLVLHEPAGVCGALHADAGGRAHGCLLDQAAQTFMDDVPDLHEVR
jgi:hypothetical protein